MFTLKIARAAKVAIRMSGDVGVASQEESASHVMLKFDRQPSVVEIDPGDSAELRYELRCPLPPNHLDMQLPPPPPPKEEPQVFESKTYLMRHPGSGPGVATVTGNEAFVCLKASSSEAWDSPELRMSGSAACQLIEDLSKALVVHITARERAMKGK